MSIFEALMLLSFGFAWPASIITSYRSRSTKGKSLSFMLIIGFGYICGILHKINHSMDPIIILYIINAVLVSIDLMLYVRNRGLERQQSEGGLS